MSTEFLHALATFGTLAGWVTGFLCGLHAAERRRTQRFGEDDDVERWMVDECNKIIGEVRAGKKS